MYNFIYHHHHYHQHMKRAGLVIGGGILGASAVYSFKYFSQHNTDNTHVISRQDYSILNEVKYRFKFRDDVEKKHGVKIERALVKFFSNTPTINETNTDDEVSDMFNDFVNWHSIYSFDVHEYRFATHDEMGVVTVKAYLENVVRKKMKNLGLEDHHYDVRTYICGTGNSIKNLRVGACVFLTPFFYRNQQELDKKIKSVIEKGK